MTANMSLERLKELYDEAYTNSHISLNEYKEAKAYYHGDQIPQDVRDTIAGRGQPLLWENVYAMIGDKILGYKATARTIIPVLLYYVSLLE